MQKESLKQLAKRKAREQFRADRALGSNWLGGSRSRPGLRPPDRRIFTQGEPSELLLRRRGLHNSAEVIAILTTDPSLRKLGLDKGKVHVLLAIHNKPQPAAQP